MNFLRKRGLAIVVLGLLSRGLGEAADWPMWRKDSVRSAVSPDPLPAELHLQWVREFEPPLPAWPETQHKIRFDTSYEPVVAGGRVFVGSMVSDRLSVLDLETGEEAWRFYAEGPIRFAPLVWRDRVYFGSDDGFLYCLETATGRLVWKQRGGPDGRLVLGNDRMISMWPVRGAPVLVEEANGEATLYYGAGIWPFMGIFLHAVDPETGRKRWSNTSSGAIFVLQQHSSPAFAGVAPQGYLAVGGDLLLVSGGRTVPAAYDRFTGAFRYFDVASRTFGKDAGGYAVSIVGDFFFNHGCLYSISNGAPALNVKSSKTLSTTSVEAIGNRIVGISDRELRVYAGLAEEDEIVTDRIGKEKRSRRVSLVETARFESPVTLRRVHAEAGGRLYASGAKGWIGAFDLPPNSQRGLSWQSRVEGEVWNLVPAENRLLAVTEEGAIYCFGEERPTATPRRHDLSFSPSSPREAISGPDGYALLLGAGEGAFDRAVELAERFHLLVVEPDSIRAAGLRRRFDAIGLLGRRVHVMATPVLQLSFPPHWASHVEIHPSVREEAESRELLASHLWKILRPYGGAIEWRGKTVSELEAMAADRRGEGVHAVETADAMFSRKVRMVRSGPLPGSAFWTHQYADVANTVVSTDRMVRAPLGLLWFGGPSHEDILPRHGHGPSPQVVGGRLFIEGPDVLRAVDVYTGRLLWQRAFPGLGRFYDNTEHQPGANEIGGNYVSLADGIYVVYEKRCLRLDPATGEVRGEFRLPRDQGDAADPHWGYIGILGEVLLAGASPIAIEEQEKGGVPRIERNVPYASSSLRLVALDRHTGHLLWQRKAGQSFRHNAIVAGSGRVFCIDGLSAVKREMLKRRGEEPPVPATLYALDLQTGRVLWKNDEGIFGTWLGYSEAHDLVLEAGSPARDRASDEAKGQMAAWRGADGVLVWRRTFSYMGKPILHGSVIYTEGSAFELLTGKPLEREHPITGQRVPWRYLRHYGCNTPIAGQHLLLFRSAAAGFYDLDRQGGTGNWGGFKSGCTANLIPADGVLSAPDYTRTCTCSYQNQCSLALVSMEDVEVWTFQGYDRLEGPIRRLGVNFGAPGDWPAPDGTLWLEYPMVGGPGPDLGVQFEGKVSWFCAHALEREGIARQVTASGFEGEAKLRIPIHRQGEAFYRIRLYFAEPDEKIRMGERRFDLFLQGTCVEREVDILARAGAPRTGFLLEISSQVLKEVLVLELRASPGSVRLPILCGVELLALEDPVSPDPTLGRASKVRSQRSSGGWRGGQLPLRRWKAHFLALAKKWSASVFLEES